MLQIKGVIFCVKVQTQCEIRETSSSTEADHCPASTEPEAVDRGKGFRRRHCLSVRMQIPSVHLMRHDLSVVPHKQILFVSLSLMSLYPLKISPWPRVSDKYRLAVATWILFEPGGRYHMAF